MSTQLSWKRKLTTVWNFKNETALIFSTLVNDWLPPNDNINAYLAQF